MTLHSPGTDAAAQAAAAFAACSALYNGRTLSPSGSANLTNTSYAETLFTHAQQLYAFATNSSIPQVTYQTSVPSVADAYASSGFYDELAIAALFMALAGNSSSDYAQATQIYTQQNLAGHLQADAVFDWDEKTPGAAILGLQIANSYSYLANTSSVNWKEDIESYLDRIVNDGSRAFLTPGKSTTDSAITNITEEPEGGLLYYPGDSDEATLNPALNAAMLLMHYAGDGLASTADRQTSYVQFAQGQIDYAMGHITCISHV